MSIQTLQEEIINNKAGRFQKLQEQGYETFVAKNIDYGNSTKTVQEILGAKSHLPRMMDKILRVNNLLNSDVKPKVRESVKDSLMDLANYALIMILDLGLDKEQAND